MAKHRGGKAKHAPGYVCLKAVKVSPAQVRARAKKAKEITDGKKKKQQEQVTAISLAKKAAKVQRRAEADAMESERRYKRY